MSNRDAGMWFFGFFTGAGLMFVITMLISLIKALIP